MAIEAVHSLRRQRRAAGIRVAAATAITPKIAPITINNI